MSSECKDEDWDDFESSIVECDRCGDIRKCKYTADPYMSEVHPEEEIGNDWWCYLCWEQRHGDV